MKYELMCSASWHSYELTRTHLKTLDTIGNCQRPAFSPGVHVSEHMHKRTNLRKFLLNLASKCEKHSCHTNLCAFRCLILRPQNLILRSWNQISGKLLLSRKLHVHERHFKGSRFSHCFILSPASPITRYQVRFMLIHVIILSNYQ